MSALGLRDIITVPLAALMGAVPLVVERWYTLREPLGHPQNVGLKLAFFIYSSPFANDVDGRGLRWHIDFKGPGRRVA